MRSTASGWLAVSLYLFRSGTPGFEGAASGEKRAKDAGRLLWPRIPSADRQKVRRGEDCTAAYLRRRSASEADRRPAGDLRRTAEAGERHLVHPEDRRLQAPAVDSRNIARYAHSDRLRAEHENARARQQAQPATVRSHCPVALCCLPRLAMLMAH